MSYEAEKYIAGMTVAQLKTLIKECLREMEDEKQFTENNYKALWMKPPMTIDG